MPTEDPMPVQALSLMPEPDMDIMVQQTVVFEFRYRPLGMFGFNDSFTISN